MNGWHIYPQSENAAAYRIGFDIGQNSKIFNFFVKELKGEGAREITIQHDIRPSGAPSHPVCSISTDGSIIVPRFNKTDEPGYYLEYPELVYPGYDPKIPYVDMYNDALPKCFRKGSNRTIVTRTDVQTVRDHGHGHIIELGPLNPGGTIPAIEDHDFYRGIAVYVMIPENYLTVPIDELTVDGVLTQGAQHSYHVIATLKVDSLSAGAKGAWPQESDRSFSPSSKLEGKNEYFEVIQKMDFPEGKPVILTGLDRLCYYKTFETVRHGNGFRGQQYIAQAGEVIFYPNSFSSSGQVTQISQEQFEREVISGEIRLIQPTGPKPKRQLKPEPT